MSTFTQFIKFYEVKKIIVSFICLFLFIGFFHESKPTLTDVDRQAGKHCVDSSARFILKYKIQPYLKDPDSYQYADFSVFPNNNNRHMVLLTYRAKNSFGGYTVGTATAYVNHSDCSIIDNTLTVK